MKVLVEDLRYGYRSDPVFCPLARAARRELWTKKVRFDRVWVSDDLLVVYVKNNAYVYKLSKNAQRFVKWFDNTDPWLYTPALHHERVYHAKLIKVVPSTL